MQNTTPETIQIENLENVTGGGWLDMLSGGKLNIGTLLGGSSNLLGTNKDGTGKGLAQGISSLLGFGGEGIFKTVEGKDPER